MLGAWAITLVLSAAPAGRAIIPGGRFAPLFGLDAGQTSFAVATFALDRELVTNSELARFIDSHPEWSKARVPNALADERYLRHFSDGAPATDDRAAPAVWVSWFAAEAFCEARGGRLPSTLQWEYAGAASERERDASRSPAFVARILAWYSRPNDPAALRHGSGWENVYGVRDLHERVWEWTLDFNGAFNTADNRQDGDKIASMFCGNGATGSARRDDYAAFMRYALRSSLSARSTLSNLGFRCAYDVDAKEK